MTKIIAVNQTYLMDPRLDLALSNINQHDRQMLAYFCELSSTMHSYQLGLIPRSGDNMLPFNTDVLSMTNSHMPEYDSEFAWTWTEVTDHRAQQLQSLLAQGKHPVVLWSGGIDSTCVLVSLLKNLDRHDLQQITVACNNFSILENPVFYHQHVLPNFKTIDVNDYLKNQFIQDEHTMVIDGYAADTLNMSMTPSLDVVMALRNSHLLTRSWRSQPDELIEYLATVTGSKLFARWYYDRNRQSVESVPVPIETYFDFMWWIGFNCEWYAWNLHSWFFFHRHTNMSYEKLQQKTFGWYRCDQYQQWAMSNTGPGVKHGKDLASFKIHPKQYIYEFDRNPDFFRFKTKVNSTGIRYQKTLQKPFAVTQDFQVWDLDQHLESILENLHTHVKL